MCVLFVASVFFLPTLEGGHLPPTMQLLVFSSTPTPPTALACLVAVAPAEVEEELGPSLQGPSSGDAPVTVRGGVLRGFSLV